MVREQNSERMVDRQAPDRHKVDGRVSGRAPANLGAVVGVADGASERDRGGGGFGGGDALLQGAGQIGWLGMG